MKTHSPLLLASSYSPAFFFGVLITFLVGLVAPRSLAFLPLVLGLIFYVSIFITNKQLLKPALKESILLGLVIILGFASSLWAPEPDFSMEATGKISGIFIFGLVLLTVVRNIAWPTLPRYAYYLIAFHLIIALALFTEKSLGHPVIEYVTGHSVYSFKLNRCYVVFALFTLPVLFMIKNLALPAVKKYGLLALTLGIAILSLSATESQTAQLCFLIGLILTFLYPAKWRWPIKAAAVLVTLFVLTLPFTVKHVQDTVPEETLTQGILGQASIVHRLEIWNFAADLAYKSPIYGNGIESIRSLKSDTYMKHQEAYGALHAHNAILQIWAEFGIIGIVLGIALLLYIFSTILKTSNAQARHLYLTMFLTIFCCAFTGYGIWQSWLIGMFFALAAFTIYIGRKIENQTA